MKHSSYLKCSDDLFDICLNSMREHPDYFLSSGSIYRGRYKCPTSTTQDVSFQFMQMLNDKLRNKTFISMGVKYKVLKTDLECGEKSSTKELRIFFFILTYSFVIQKKQQMLSCNISK